MAGAEAAAFRLPDDLRLGPVHLRVSDLDRSLEFYRGVLGLDVRTRENGRAYLGAGGEDLLVLSGGFRGPRPAGTSGLYHFALLVPSRRDLAFALRHLSGVTRLGSADHAASEALYLYDPDQNGIEVYRDRPRAEWRGPDGKVRLVNDPLDVEGILGELEDDATPWTGLAPGTVMGHVHLQVSDVAEARRFYVELLGFDLIAALPQALFVSAGGYHHHVGLNTWHSRGGPPTPPETVGLDHFVVRLGDAAARDRVVERVREAGGDVEVDASRATLHDPSGNRMVLET